MATFYISILGKNILSDHLDPKWKPFKNMVLDAGISLVDTRLADFFVSVEHSRKQFKRNSHTLVKNRMLVVVEPAVVHPRQHLTSVRKLYGNVLVLTNGFSVLGNERVWQGGHLPNKKTVLKLLDENVPISNRSNSAGLINAQKYSFVKGSLYKKRLQILRELADSWNGDVYLAGHNWNASISKLLVQQLYALIAAVLGGKGVDLRVLYSHRFAHTKNLHLVGPQETQHKFLSQIKFAIVVENQANYVSEKLLNAFVSGCVPIYIGGDLNEYGIPEDSVVQLSSNVENVSEILNELSEDKIEQIVYNGKKYITSDKTLDRWSIERGFYLLVNEILDLEKSESSS
jgi:hypothetical protein